MKRGLLTILIVLWASTAWSATFLSESFEEIGAGDGLDDTWTISAGSGVTDPDNADVARPTGGGTQVFKVTMADTNNATFIRHNAGVGGKPIVRFRVYFRMPVWRDDDRFLAGQDTTLSSYLMLYMETTPANRLRIVYYNNGSLVTEDVTDALGNDFAINTWYRFEWYYNKTPESEHITCRVDGVDKVDAALSGVSRLNHQYLAVGAPFDDGSTDTYYFDLIKANDAGDWIGAESGGAPAVMPRRGTIIFITNRLKRWLTPSAWAGKEEN